MRNFSRRNFLQASIVAAVAAPGPVRAMWGTHGGDPNFLSPDSPATAPAKPSFPVTDFHVHLSSTLTIERAVALGKERGVQIGVLEHPGVSEKIKTDADLKQYIEMLRQYPVRVGLQPIYAGWSKAFSKALLDQLDYILMDALTLPKADGSAWAIWQIDTMVDDEEQFMVQYMQFIEQILTTEPMDVFGWPTFLPVPIAREYSRLWTRQRVDRIIDLCANPPKGSLARKIAIEINEVAHVPDDKFIRRAKQAGLKFTFGTDSRNDHAAHFYYCYQIAQRCGLTEGDMFTPRKSG